MTTPFEKVSEFHHHFDPVAHKKQIALSKETAEHRSGFKLEEIIEFLYAANSGNATDFNDSINYLHHLLDQEAKKILASQKKVDPLVDEVDALIDLLYFTYGSFVMMNVDPGPLFEIVHQANMGKLFPDGKPRYHEVTGKVLKPKEWTEKFAPEGKIKEELERQKASENNLSL